MYEYIRIKGREGANARVIHDIMSAARNSEATEHPNNYEKTEFLKENKTKRTY